MMTAQSERTDILDGYYRWRTRVVQNNSFSCIPIDFAESQEWAFREGALKHRTGGFFSLVGVEATSRFDQLDGREQLIIFQPEIAINGFLIRRLNDCVEVLFQGRVEPGNIDAFQLAPTVQSTEANYKRMHGGAATPFVEWFLEENSSQTLYDKLQSEEGTRYHGKYNRNVVLEIPTDKDLELPSQFRWYSLNAIREFAISDNILNTDSRSVLSCMDWDLLAGPGQAFRGHASGTYGEHLMLSYCSDEDQAECSTLELFEWLTRLRVWGALRTQIKPITELKNWIIDAGEIRELNPERGFVARQYKVEARKREVVFWDQPLIDSQGIGHIALVSQMRCGVLHFLIKASCEIGYLEGVQLSASVMIAPGEVADESDPIEREILQRIESGDGVEVILHLRQSEEGGRFYEDENNYQIVLLDERVVIPESDYYRWITLNQVKNIIQVPGIFSIEFRGALTLLISYL